MPNLFTWFQNYLNPSKLTAVTVPGMIVAFALILVLGPIPCRKSNPKSCPLCVSTLKPVEDSADSKSGARGDQTRQSPPAGTTSPSGETTTTNLLPKPAGEKIYVRVSQVALKQENTTKDIDNLIDSIKKVSGQFSEPDKDRLKPIQEAELILANSVQKIGDSCNDVPSYFVPNSTAIISDADLPKEQQAAAKKAQDLRTLVDQPVGSSLQSQQSQSSSKPMQIALNACNSQVQLINAALLQDSANLDKFISQGFTDLQALSTALVAAQQNGDTLVGKSISSNIHDKRNFLSWAQQEQAIIKNISTSLAALQSRITTMLNVVIGPPPDAKPGTNVATDVFQTIQENLLKFLLFSLILGQILDPIQRGAVSFFGPRRNFFSAFNKVYGQRGDGEFRYGDRRLEPWVSNDALGEIDKRQTDVMVAELRPNAAGKAFEKDRNIYDKNYAIGAGYVSQSEVKTIEDEYYAQSQITSGLILPMLILSVCIALRVICCSPNASANYSKNFFVAAAASSFGIVLGIGLMMVALLLSSRKYWRVFSQGAKDVLDKLSGLRINIQPSRKKLSFKSKEEREDWEGAEADGLPSKWRVRLFAIGAIGLLVWWTIAILLQLWDNEAKPTLLEWWDLLLISIPVLLIGPLWIAGLDRLHKYYSELEARIAGNILRLQENTEKKILDIIADPDAAAALTTKIKDTVDGEQKLANFLSTIVGETSVQPSPPPDEPPPGVPGAANPPKPGGGSN
jgi:hypothetical protein